MYRLHLFSNPIFTIYIYVYVYMYLCIYYVHLSIWIPYIIHPFQELHGLSALLQALEHLRSSPFATKAALISLRTSARARWNEVEAQDAFQVIRVPRMDMMDMAILRLARWGKWENLGILDIFFLGEETYWLDI